MRNGKNFKPQNKQGGKPRNFRNSKETEINIKDSDINSADLAGFRSSGRKSEKNDVAWYSKSPALLRDAASFPYSWPVGAKLPWSSAIARNTLFSVAGLCVLDYTPGIGRSLDTYSPVNVAARNFFTYVRKANSGQTNYETSDLMMYLLSMDSAYQTYALMVRAYGVATLYAQENRYLGKALLSALHLDADDIYANLAQLRYHINLLAYKLNNMCVPSSVAYIQRHSWMASGLYADSPTPKAQIYAFNPTGYYTFVEVTEGPAYLRFKYFGVEGGKWTVEELVDASNEQLEAILASQDFNIMSGDILKAFGESNLYTVPTIDENFVVLPSYNTEVLSQIENATALGYGSEGPADGQDNINNIVQKQNEFLESYIYYNPSFSYSMIGSIGEDSKYPNMHKDARGLWGDYRLINMHKADVTPADTMVATRLTVPATATTNSQFNRSMTIKPTNFGSEVINAIRLVQFVASAGNTPTLNETILHYIDVVTPLVSSDVTDNSKANVWMMRTSVLSQFDWAPQHYAILNNTLSTDTSARTSVMFKTSLDLDMYTMMNSHDLDRLHEVALLSLFEVGQTGVKIGP